MTILKRNLDPLNYGGGSREVANIMPGTNVIQALGQSFAQNQGIIDISNGQIISDKPKPKNLRVNVISSVAAGDEDATIYLFNNNSLNALDTDNGGGAGTISYTWGDGFTGKGYEQLMRSNITGFGGKPEMGIGIRGFTVQVTKISTGASDGSYFNTMNLNIEMANLNGRMMPFNSDVVDAIRNTQYRAGILTVIFPFVFNPWMQISYTQSPDTKFEWTFMTEWSANLQ